MRLLLYSLLMLLLLPLIVLGLLFLVGPIVRTRGRVSGTTYEPFITRLVCHLIGSRPDAAALQLAPGLPATNHGFMTLTARPVAWASRVTGFVPGPMRFPVSEPVPMSALVTARFEFLNRALLDHAPETGQVVILGAGWDTRCYGPLKSQDVKLFEVDTPATQALKRAAIDKTGIDASHVTFVSCDFNRRSWLDALVESGFDPGVRTFVLCEAVSMYLQNHAVQSTLRAVASLPAGSRIAFDFFTQSFLDGLQGKLYRFAIWMGYGERWFFGMPGQPDVTSGLTAYLEEQGLDLDRCQVLGGDAPYYAFAVAVTPATMALGTTTMMEAAT